MQTECAVCWGAEFPLAGEAEIVGAVAGAVAGSITITYFVSVPFISQLNS